MTKTQLQKVLAAASTIERLYTSVGPVLIAAADMGNADAAEARNALLIAVTKLRFCANGGRGA